MIDKTCRIILSVPGNNREIAADVVLADLAKKLRAVGSLAAGQHEILIFGDGSVVLDAALVYEPPKAQPVPQQPNRKGG